MIVDMETAREYIRADWPDKLLMSKIKAVEQLIRSETNNRFQDIRVRFYGPSSGGELYGSSPYLVVGDSIEIGESVNDGVYTITEIADGTVKVDGPLFNAAHNMVTKLFYPEDIRMGALNLLKWDATGREKVGIKSESLSRHSVTYYDMDSSNSAAGYPAALLGFLEPYVQPRI